MVKKLPKKFFIRESNEIVDATHVLGLSEIRVIQLCLAKYWTREGLKEDKFYEIPLKEYAKIFNIENHSAYEALLEVCTTLKQKLIILNTTLINPSARKTAKTIISWVDRIDYDPKDSCIKIRWHRDIIPFFNNFGADNPYSKYYLENTRYMKSIYSIRLFRVLNKWLKLGKFEISIIELKRLLGIDEGKYSQYDNFRRKVLLPALKEIETYSDIEADFISNSDRNITDLVFRIRKKDG